MATQARAVPIEDQARLSLFHLEQQLVELFAWRDSTEAETERAACEQAIAVYVQQEVHKVDSIRAYIRHAEVMAEGAADEESRQCSLKKMWRRRADCLKAYCLHALQSCGKKRVEGRSGYLLVKPNGGKDPVVIENEALIPDRFCTWVRQIRIDEIREALAAGEDVPGARLGGRGVHLEVK